MTVGVLITDSGYDATKNFYAKITPASILVFPIVKEGSTYSISNIGSVSVKVRLFTVNQKGLVAHYDVDIDVSGTHSGLSTIDGYMIAVARDESGYPIDFNYLTGSATVVDFGTYSSYGVRSLSVLNWLPLPVVGLPFGKLTLSGGYEITGNAIMLPIKSTSKIVLAYVNGDLSYRMNQMHAGFMSQFGNGEGQSITNYATSAPTYTVLSGTPLQVFNTLVYSTYNLSSIEAIVSSHTAFWSLEQRSGKGLLFALVFDNETATPQINVGGSSLGSLIIKYPVT